MRVSMWLHMGAGVPGCILGAGCDAQPVSSPLDALRLGTAPGLSSGRSVQPRAGVFSHGLTSQEVGRWLVPPCPRQPGSPLGGSPCVLALLQRPARGLPGQPCSLPCCVFLLAPPNLCRSSNKLSTIPPQGLCAGSSFSLRPSATCLQGFCSFTRFKCSLPGDLYRVQLPASRLAVRMDFHTLWDFLTCHVCVVISQLCGGTQALREHDTRSVFGCLGPGPSRCWRSPASVNERGLSKDRRCQCLPGCAQRGLLTAWVPWGMEGCPGPGLGGAPGSRPEQPLLPRALTQSRSQGRGTLAGGAG